MRLEISVDKKDLQEIVSTLRNYTKSEESLLKTAVNNTARQAQSLLIRQAQQVYKGEAPRGIKKRSSIKKATVSSLGGAKLEFKSRQHDLTRFNVSANARVPTVAVKGGKRRKILLRGTQFREGQKDLVYETGGKRRYAFAIPVNRHADGSTKTVIVEHASGRKLKTYMGSSDAVLIRNEKVYGAVEDRIGEILRGECRKLLDKVKGGG